MHDVIGAPKLIGNHLVLNKSSSIQKTTSDGSQKPAGRKSTGNLKELKQNGDIEPIKEEINQEKINSLLDQTDILEENFYFAHSRTSIIEKSFVVPKGSFSLSQKSSVMLQQQLKNYNEEEKSNNASDVCSNPGSVESYKNNTFINNVPVSMTKVSVGTGAGNGTGVNLENQSSSNLELLENIHNYKMVTSLIEKHFQSSTNVFNQMINKFSKFYNDKYEPVILGFQNKTVSRDEIFVQINDAVSDLQQFIRLLYESLNIFYRLDKLKMGDISSRENIFNRDNMINFVTSLALSEPLYNKIFELLRINDLNTEEAFEHNLVLCGQKLPTDVGIPPEFCLNEKTLEYYFGDVSFAFKNITHDAENPGEAFSFNKRRQSKKTNFSNLLETNNVGTFNPSVNLSSSVASEPDGHGEATASYITGHMDLQSTAQKARELMKEPYAKCIKVLKRLEHLRSPIHKMKTIVKVAELINISIQEFYKIFKINKSFKLDADQTLSIFIYIVVKAGVKSLATHIKIIEKFTTSNVLNSISGYYATTLEACVNCIINMDLTDNQPDHSREEFYDNLKEYLHSNDRDGTH